MRNVAATLLRFVLRCVLSCALVFATTSAQAQENTFGKFVLSAPVSAEARELSMRWQFGLELKIDPQEIDQVKFSCSQFFGSTFTVKFSEMQRKGAAYYADGPVTPVSSKTMPWLFDPSFTLATCNATIHTIWNTLFVIPNRLHYSTEMKAEMLQKLKAAHESTLQLKKR